VKRDRCDQQGGRRHRHRHRQQVDVPLEVAEHRRCALCGCRGGTGRTGVVTCTWTDHPGQRHKAIRQRDDGGVNVFRRRYWVAEPAAARSRDAGLVDEVALYARFRERSWAADPGGRHVLLRRTGP
jgi:hypothetical protein